MSDVSAQAVEAIKQSDNPTLVKLFALFSSAFLSNPIKVGFAGLLILFGYQVTSGQKELAHEIRSGYEQLDARHATAAAQAHADFARAQDKLDSSINRLAGKLDENTRAILTKGK